MKKSTRTISGITPVSVMTQPMGCPGHCIYCPTYLATPQSYTPESPTVLRAKQCDYDARKQIGLRLKTLQEMGHPTSKVELIIMGGTFLAYPKGWQYSFIKDCYDALNGIESTSLEQAKQLNEKANHRCVGLCIETRPDFCRLEHIERMLKFGTTRVELGVQTLDDEIYRLIRREHKVEDVAKATALLKQHGFKVHYHWMPGLPGSTPANDLELSKKLFSDTCFRPDGLKIYPTMVVEDTELERWYLAGYYQPYDSETMINLVAGIKTIIPKYVRISRVLRDIPPKFIVAGVKNSLRSYVKERMRELAVECRCIRCREYGHRVQNGREIGKPKMTRIDYEASDGKEVFLSFEDEAETLFGLLRMRIQSEPPAILEQRANGNLALVRELHVYGPEVPLKEQNLTAVQHKGLGKALLTEAERIAGEEFQARQIFTLSGIGAKEYYHTQLDYSYQGNYMVKRLQAKTLY
ncbi:elongator complex protein 3 [Chloroflexota bacterium]